MVDDPGEELLVDHAGDQQQHLLPRRVGRVPAEHLGDEFLGAELLGLLEPVDDLVGAAVLQERPVHETVDARPEPGQDEVAVPELLQYRLGDDLGLVR